MPTDTLGDDAQNALRGAREFLRSNQADAKLSQYHLRNLQSAERRLADDITERSTTYLTELHKKETATVDELAARLNLNQKFVHAANEAKAHQRTFDSLRQINGGAYPRNFSPVLYVIPLILLGVAEWYVNYATFASIFIPVFAIAGTLIVAAVFAWASHMHGSFLKQISEILHPSVEYRNVLGRKIALYISTVMLLCALATIVWLRYDVIAAQLGINQNSSAGTFGTPSGEMIWSRLGPTIVLNVMIWGIGTLYSWAMNEKVPGLREFFRSWRRAVKKLARITKPTEAEQLRVKASFSREREKNDVAIKENRTLLEEVHAQVQRMAQD